MPSPFPGMDPYLEDNHIWADLHGALLSSIHEVLASHLPSHCYVRVERRADFTPIDESEICLRVRDARTGEAIRRRER